MKKLVNLNIATFETRTVFTGGNERAIFGKARTNELVSIITPVETLLTYSQQHSLMCS
jgi:hypothetical protein